MISVGIVGLGYWGPNLVRNFSEAAGTRVAAVCDMNPQRLASMTKKYPGIAAVHSMDELLEIPGLDAVAIATPVSSHFDLAMKALRANKHVLIEKPMTTNSDDACRLIEEAESRNLVLMVDHTFVYTGAVRKIKQMVESGDLGKICYYDSIRVNLGLFQHDTDVIWDLAVHDLAIMDYVFHARPRTITAAGMNHIEGARENIAYITVLFEEGLIAHINVNWLSPVKVRRTLIGGSQRMIVYDDLEASEKIKIYDKGVTVTSRPESMYKLMIGYRTGDMHAPQLEVTEALRLEAQHFADCIETGAQPLTDGYSGLRVVQMLEAATASMRRQGAPAVVETEELRAAAFVA